MILFGKQQQFTKPKYERNVESMNALLYFIIYQISRLPFGVHYFFADILYFVIYRLIGYRRRVIRQNLEQSFPEKSPTEIKSIQKKFYKNFSDYLVETLKSFSITQDQLDQRHRYSNLQVFNEVIAEEKNVVLMCGHIFNWEWYIGLSKHLPYDNTTAVYHKIKNPFWDEKMVDMRGKYGTKTIDMKDILRFMLKTPNNGEMCYFFVADQSPREDAIHYRINFLNQDTPVFNGFDRIIRRQNMAAIFCKTIKIKRGHYHTSFERMIPKGEKFEENEVVHLFFNELETTIKENPDNWLWSHKRWKYAND